MTICSIDKSISKLPEDISLNAKRGLFKKNRDRITRTNNSNKNPE
jgi:hypothetical protein